MKPIVQIQQRVLPGPPVSRAKQRKLGIVRFVPGLGYSKLPCAKCGKHVWIGPHQAEWLAQHPECSIVCFCCVRIQAGDVLTNLNGRGPGYYFSDGAYAGPTEGKS
jgi:hypothetical protein